MKHKKYKLRFIRNVAICVFALLIVARLLDVMPGFKRNKTEGITNLVIGDEDITEELNNNIFIDENNIVYLSLEDVKELFDNSIIFNKEENQILTTSRTKVATMELNEKYIMVNNTLIDTLGSLRVKNEIVYLPISEMGLVYNIEVHYIPETDIVTIDKLDKQLIKGTIANRTNVKYKMRGFSQTLAEVTEGEQISYYEEDYKGWTKIRTDSGIVGYIKTSVIANQYVIRQDMQQEINAEKINENEVAGWLTIKENSLEIDMLKEYKTRAQVIDTIVSFVLSENAKGVVIYSDLNNENMISFMREVSPRLREMGIYVAIQSKNSKGVQKLKNIVDYIVE